MSSIEKSKSGDSFSSYPSNHHSSYSYTKSKYSQTHSKNFLHFILKNIKKRIVWVIQLFWRATGVSKKSFESKIHILASSIASIFTAFVMFGSCATRFSKWLESGSINELIITIVTLIGSFLILFNLLVLFWFDKFYHFHQLIWLFIGQTALVLIHISSGRGLNSASLISSLLFLIWATIFYSQFTFFFVCFDIVLIFFCYLFDLIISPSEITNTLFVQLINYYTPLTIICFILFCLFLKNINESKSLKMLENVTHIIKSLNFKSQNNKKILDSFKSVNSTNSPAFLYNFKQIVDQIIEYKRFLPLSLVDNSEENDDSHMIETDQGNTSHYSNSSSHSSSFSSSSHSSLNIQKKEGKLFRSNSNNNIRREITYVTIKLKNLFSSSSDKSNDKNNVGKEEICLKFEEIIQKIDQISKLYRGSIIHFDIDTIEIVFNTFEKTVNHQKNACEFGVKIIEAFKTNEDLQICIAITSSFVIVKNLGTKNIKRLSLIGTCIILNKYLQSLFSNQIYANEKNKCGLKTGIIVDANIRKYVKYYFYFSCLEYVKDHNSFIYRLNGSKNLNENKEWNYVIDKKDLEDSKPKKKVNGEEKDKSGIKKKKELNPGELLTIAWKLFGSNKYEESETILKEYFKASKDLQNLTENENCESARILQKRIILSKVKNENCDCTNF